MKNLFLILLVFMVFFLPGQTAFAQNNSDISELEAYLTPPSGWEIESRPLAAFDDDALFERINGGAMQYVQLGFKRALFVTFIKNQWFINLELFEMKSSKAAHEIFVIKADSAKAVSNIGREAVLADYYLMFSKGNFFISLSGSESGEQAEKILIYLAKSIARKMGPE